MTTVYPRVLGERSVDEFEELDDDGLSPCARGTHRIKQAFEITIRFIPVCSGNAPPFHPRKSRGSVYPRVLGERWRVVPRHDQCGGLSPCARGTLSTSKWAFSLIRFIPVCSGNACFFKSEGAD